MVGGVYSNIRLQEFACVYLTEVTAETFRLLTMSLDMFMRKSLNSLWNQLNLTLHKV